MSSNSTGNHFFQAEATEPGAPSAELEEPGLPYAGFTWTEGLIIAGVGLLIGGILTLSALTGPSCCTPSTQAEALRSTIGRISYLFFWGLSAVPIFWACVRLRPRTAGWGTTLVGHALLALTIPFAVEMGQNVVYAGLIAMWPPPDPPSSTLTPPGEVLANLEFLTELIPYLALLIIGLIREGYLRGEARQEQAEQLEREAEQLRAKLTAARLESLRMQINPHFFHNTLHTISTMAGRDPEGIRTAAARLSDLMRYVLSTSEQQEVPLEEELDVLESYLDIQKLRLGNRLEVTMDIDPAAREALVPTLVLQPLVENAVKHGFEGTDEAGHLHVQATLEGGDLALVVGDDGNGLPKEASVPGDGRPSIAGGLENGHGLNNIAERLEGLYGDAASLRFDESEGGGLQVTIRLPFRTHDSERNLRATGVVAE